MSSGPDSDDPAAGAHLGPQYVTVDGPVFRRPGLAAFDVTSTAARYSGVTDRPWITVQVSGEQFAPDDKIVGGKLSFGAFRCYCSLVAAVADDVVVLGVGVEAVHGQSCAGVAGVGDLAVANVDGDVRDAAVAVKYEVTGLQLALGDFLCGGVLCC